MCWDQRDDKSRRKKRRSHSRHRKARRTNKYYVRALAILVSNIERLVKKNYYLEQENQEYKSKLLTLLPSTGIDSEAETVILKEIPKELKQEISEIKVKIEQL